MTKGVACCVASIAAAVAHAGQIGYSINGGTVQTVTVSDTAPFSDIEISLGDRSGNTDVHIFDISGVDTSLGMITLRGRFTGSSGKVRVWIADPLETDGDTIFSDVTSEFDPGLRNLGGIQFVGPTADPTNTSLRQAAAISVNIRGDLTDNVTAGSIFRVDVRRYDDVSVDPSLHFGGTISGDVTATRIDG